MTLTTGFEPLCSSHQSREPILAQQPVSTNHRPQPPLNHRFLPLLVFGVSEKGLGLTGLHRSLGWVSVSSPLSLGLLYRHLGLCPIQPGDRPSLLLFLLLFQLWGEEHLVQVEEEVSQVGRNHRTDPAEAVVVAVKVEMRRVWYDGIEVLER